MLTFTHEATRQNPRIRRVWDLHEVGLPPWYLEPLALAG